MAIKSRGIRILWWVLGTAAVLSAAAVIMMMFVLRPNGESAAAMTSDGRVRVAKEEGWISFTPQRAAASPSVIIYPGAFAPPGCYAALARRIAEQGHPVYVVNMPFNLSIFGQNRAADIISAHPGDAFVVGGHSVGGMTAARYADKHPDSVKGLFLLASFGSGHAGLLRAKLPVLQITASHDGLMKWDVQHWKRRGLPDDTVHVSVQGGNHMQFGSFLTNEMDGRAVITGKRQLEIVAGAIHEWLNKINRAKTG